MAKLYAVSVRWIGTPANAENVGKMDAAIGTTGDWIRFNGWTWLVWTQNSAEQVSSAIRRVIPHDEDSLLVIACDPNDFNGYAAPWIWEWLRNKRGSASLSALGTGFGLPPRRG